MDMEMDYDFEKKCIVDVDGFVEAGKQFDLEINLEEDRRNVIFGVVKDSCNEPIKDAVVKLLEVTKHGRNCKKEGKCLKGVDLCCEGPYESEEDCGCDK